MQMNPLGRSGSQVSKLCLGTMTFGRTTAQDAAFEMMDRALDVGVNFFDCAEMYPVGIKAEDQGASEEVIGNWFKDRGRRNEVHIATKATGPSRAEWIRGPNRRLDKPNLQQAVEDSLRRLQVEAIDLYQLHWPDRAVPLFGAAISKDNTTDGPNVVPIEETLSALQELIDAGKIKHIGLSNESAYGTMKWVEAAERTGMARVVSIQNAYSLLNRSFEEGLAEVAMREDVGLLPYAPIAAGFLTGKYIDGAEPEGARYTIDPSQTRYRKPNAEPAIKAYMALADEVGIKCSHMALAFCYQQPFVTSTIAGARTVEQSKSLFASLEVTLSEDTLARINEIHQVYKNPCP